jgi:hypothetical protein
LKDQNVLFLTVSQTYDIQGFSLSVGACGSAVGPGTLIPDVIDFSIDLILRTVPRFN